MHGAVDTTHIHTQPARIDVTLDEEDLEAVFWKPARSGDAPALARPRDSSMSMTTATGWRPAKALVQQCSRPRQYPAQRKRTRAIMRPAAEDRVQSTDRGSSASGSGIRAKGAHHGLRLPGEGKGSGADAPRRWSVMPVPLSCWLEGVVEVHPPACLPAASS
jgi:hypothetical protein